jgi:hypothetical protein
VLGSGGNKLLLVLLVVDLQRSGPMDVVEWIIVLITTHVLPLHVLQGVYIPSNDIVALTRRMVLMMSRLDGGSPHPDVISTYHLGHHAQWHHVHF